MMIRPAFFVVLTLLAACGGKDARILISEPAGAETERRVGSIGVELREITLPAYASAADILVQEPDGALRSVRGAVWAGDPVHDMTAALAERLDLRTTARVAAEPWPLSDGPDRRVEVRIERLVAGNDGMLKATGQVAVSSPMGGRERLDRFSVSVPIADTNPPTLGRAMGAALDQLAGQIAGML